MYLCMGSIRERILLIIWNGRSAAYLRTPLKSEWVPLSHHVNEMILILLQMRFPLPHPPHPLSIKGNWIVIRAYFTKSERGYNMCLALKALNPVLIVVWVHLPLPDERASVKQGGDWSSFERRKSSPCRVLLPPRKINFASRQGDRS